MIFKKDSDKADFGSGKIRPKLHRLLEDLDKFCVDKESLDLVVTSLCSLSDKHSLDSQHYHGEAADIRAHHFTAPQLAMILNFVHETHWRNDVSGVGRPMRAAYPHGDGDNFHIHLSIDKGERNERP
jgi:hypothetical protein